MARERRSLDIMYKEWDENREPGLTQLETFITAMRKIQEIKPGPADNPTWNSFFTLAGYHGQPFRGTGTADTAVWGGYCNHGNVLFPTWHRALLLNFEDALRSIAGCENVTLPFWDELLYMWSKLPNIPYVPDILTNPKFKSKRTNTEIDNPLYSYKLRQAINDRAQLDQRYTKPEDYETVRYPLSGLVGTYEARQETAKHNQRVLALGPLAKTLSANVGAWLREGPIIPDDGGTRRPRDITSAYKRYQDCLNAPNYTVFSNTESQGEWNSRPGTSHLAMSLESPHNAIHLALGGFYQKGVYNADPIRGANGDMGANEMAGFDPIFYLHHCFIDYAFWKWQEGKGLRARGSLTIEADITKGTVITTQDAGYPLAEKNTDVGIPLTMATPLHPFRNRNNMLYTSHDVTNIVDLGYSYGLGSIDALTDGRTTLPQEGEFDVVFKQPITGINRADYQGSFVIRTFALLAPQFRVDLPDGKGMLEEVEVAREPILGRWNYKTCRNCQNKLEITPLIALDQPMSDLLDKDQEKLPKFRFVIQRLGERQDLETDYPPDGTVRPTPAPKWPTDGPPQPVLGAPIKLQL